MKQVTLNVCEERNVLFKSKVAKMPLKLDVAVNYVMEVEITKDEKFRMNSIKISSKSWKSAKKDEVIPGMR